MMRRSCCWSNDRKGALQVAFLISFNFNVGSIWNSVAHRFDSINAFDFSSDALMKTSVVLERSFTIASNFPDPTALRTALGSGRNRWIPDSLIKRTWKKIN